jgi:hypothetical protein
MEFVFLLFVCCLFLSCILTLHRESCSVDGKRDLVKVNLYVGVLISFWLFLFRILFILVTRLSHQSLMFCICLT